MPEELSVGNKAADFALPDHSGKKTLLSDFRGKWVVLYFYPKDNTTGCTIEAIDFTGMLEELAKLNAVVVGISPDSIESHRKFMEKHGLKVILLSDIEKSSLKKYFVWRKKSFYGKEFTGVVRSTFLITPEGKIAFAWRNISAPGHAQEVRKKLEELQE